MNKEELIEELEQERQNFKELSIENYQIERMMIVTVHTIQLLEEELYGEVKTNWEDVNI